MIAGLTQRCPVRALVRAVPLPQAVSMRRGRMPCR